jgi:leucyl/phenylalanyl-tRNA--protein transferase
VALVASVVHLFAQGVTLYDVQFLTAHLASMGAREIPRRSYLSQLDRAIKVRTAPVPHAKEEDLLPWVASELSRGPTSVVESRVDGPQRR